jgi:sugar lactone lactonase YvrE
MIIVCSFCFVSCGDEDKSGGGTEYDPSKPVVLTSFHPDSGGIASKVIFDGENFGSDPDKIKVYFNQKPATVIGSSGNRMYAVVPRMPGDTCAVSIVVGNDSVIYGQRFRYKISVTVSDVVGNGTTTLKLGNLSEATLQAFGLCVDDEGNIFTLTPDNGGSVVKANELENSLIQLPSDVRTGWAASPCIFGDGVVCFPSDNVKEVYWTLNPKEGWALKTRYMQFKEGSSIPTNTWKKSMAACELNGHLYTLFRDGHLVKINPETFEAETVRVLQLGESYGLTFHPIKKNLLYISYYDASGGSYAHSICTLDINDIENSFTKITGPTNGGHRDGELAVSQFRNPRQIFFDPEGNLYVADVGNHCIRKITTDDMVETVVGIPGVPGWKNGGKDEALFSSPTGINVTKDGTVYVGDNGNARIRKLAIE